MTKALSDKESELIEELKRAANDGVFGRGSLDKVDALSTRGIIGLISEIRASPEKAENARVALGMIVQDRLTRNQIDANEQLAEASHELTQALQEAGRRTAWRIAIVSTLVGVAVGSVLTSLFG